MENRYKYISYLSVLSCISVVYLHANGCFWTFSTERYWITANIIECVFYFAVPIFFMISGATLLDYNERYGIKTFFYKRIIKTVIPYLGWSIIAIIVDVIINQRWLPIKTIVKKIVEGNALSIYWFFPALFCVYLCIPLLAAVSKLLRKTVFSYLAIACFSLNVVIPFLLQLFKVNYTFPYTINVGCGYLLYVILGYLLNEYDLDKILRIIIYILGIIGLFLHILGTYFLSVEAGEIIRTFKGYNNLPCLLYSVSIFVFVKTIISRYGVKEAFWVNRVVVLMKRYTFSIYLMHMYFVKGILFFTNIDSCSIFYRLLCPIPAIAISILVTYVLRKIPFFKKIVPE